MSLLTQALYTLVFLSRYLDLFVVPPSANRYNFVFKLTYIASSIYILFLMLRVYARSREAEKEWRVAVWILLFAAGAAPLFYTGFHVSGTRCSALELLRDFSYILESLAVVPQLTLLAHTSVPSVINSYYLLALGSYRALYIPNWIWRAADPHDHFFEPVAVLWGVVQTLLYVEFAYIYWKRQKVKLRGGGVLDGDEFARGLVLGRLIGGDVGKSGARATGGGWRGAGVSVSADDFVVAGDDDAEDSGDELVREEAEEAGLMGRK